MISRHVFPILPSTHDKEYLLIIPQRGVHSISTSNAITSVDRLSQEMLTTSFRPDGPSSSVSISFVNAGMPP
jgi:hypothetical protein